MTENDNPASPPEKPEMDGAFQQQLAKHRRYRRHVFSRAQQAFSASEHGESAKVMRQKNRPAILRQERDQLLDEKQTLQSEFDAFREQAKLDEMTGMLDRYQVNEALERTITVFEKTQTEESREDPNDIKDFAVALPDIDLFSWWNDALQAHILGDLVLQEMGEFFERNLKDQDIKIRSGGEEFVLIILNPDGEEGAKTATGRLVRNSQDHLLESIVKNQLIASKDRAMAESTVLDGIPETPASKGSISKVDRINSALRQAIQGMVALHNNTPISIETETGVRTENALDYFLKPGNIKGTHERKTQFLDAIDSFCKGELIPELAETDVEKYLLDTRPYAELTPDEREKRNKFEQLVAKKLIPTLFKEVTLSIGLVYVDDQFPKESLNPESLKSIADKRMFLAKHTGRNRYYYLPGNTIYQ